MIELPGWNSCGECVEEEGCCDLMRIVHITPGAGGMHCGNCFRDNALVKALRDAGHDTLMIPLYLPMTLDEEDQSAGTPIFFGGINVYLEQKSSFFRSTPRWLKQLLDRPALLRWASGKAAKTRAADVGELTISMLRGEEGNQARELEELIAWLKPGGRPNIICLSNALLCGLARRLKQAFRVPVVCFLQGEDSFLDQLPETHRARAWATLKERARDIDLFVAPSAYFAGLMQERLGLSDSRVRIVHNGLNLQGFSQAPPPAVPTLGYFARMCREKGLDTLVDAFIHLRLHTDLKTLRLRVGGSCGPADHSFVSSLQEKLVDAGLGADCEFLRNVSREEKQGFYRSLTVMSVPARFGEAFGLYLIEAMASGVPVVQPRVAAFPEIVAVSGGGVLCEPEDPVALAEQIHSLLKDPSRHASIARAGRQSALAEFNVERMAEKLAELYAELARAGEPVRSRGTKE